MEPDIKIKPVAELYTNILPAETRQAFTVLADSNFLVPDWYLAGGTALALQVGHRSSEDLDFFTEQREFDIEELARLLMRYGSWETSRTALGTLYGIFEGAKVSFIAYPFFRPSSSRVRCGILDMLVPDDIMAMKVIAISQRGKKRDFIDMYWYAAIHGASIPDAIRRAVVQFPGEHNVPHFLKSLVYFVDAEDDPMPVLHFEAEWESVKTYFRREVPAIAQKLLGLQKESA